MHIRSFRITRFQFSRDRIIGDSQVRADQVNVAAIEIEDENGNVGLGFMQALFSVLPSSAEINRIFAAEVWPMLEGRSALALVHQVARPRGGNQRVSSLPFYEAVQVALWDLAAKSVQMPLWKLLGGEKDKVAAYASGLDFHLPDNEFVELFGEARELGYRAFKIKVGHVDFERDLHRLDLLKNTVGSTAGIMIDANEAWTAKEAAINIKKIQKAGFDLIWVEDPILRSDIAGLQMLRGAVSNTLINSGEYLDAAGKRDLLINQAADLINVHGQITDVMYVGRLAAELGIPVSVGNTFLETGIHAAVALPEVKWMEYSFQNFDHLVDETIQIRDGYAIAPARPGHGLQLSDHARANWARPEILKSSELGAAPQRNSAQLVQLPNIGATP